MALSEVVVLAAKGGESSAERIRVSSFSSILTEVAQRVGEGVVVVSGHVPPGADPHEFEPNPGVLRTVASAHLVLLSAKHMEGYVGKLKEAAGGKVRVVEVGGQLPSLWIKEENQAEGRGVFEDPHWWHSVPNVQRAVKVVREQLVALQPQSAGVFLENSNRYVSELEDLQRWVRGRVAELPRNRRKLVTSHDALQYFAKEYGFSVYAVEGLTPSEQPSSRKVAALLDVIREQKVKAVFAQDTVNPKVLREMTAATGAVLGGRLWVDGLGLGDAGTYAGMIRSNVNAIVEALK